MLQSNNDNGTGYLIDSKLFKLYERGNCPVIYSLISQKKNAWMVSRDHINIVKRSQSNTGSRKTKIVFKVTDNLTIK